MFRQRSKFIGEFSSFSPDGPVLIYHFNFSPGFETFHVEDSLTVAWMDGIKLFGILRAWTKIDVLSENKNNTIAFGSLEMTVKIFPDFHFNFLFCHRRKDRRRQSCELRIQSA